MSRPFFRFLMPAHSVMHGIGGYFFKGIASFVAFRPVLESLRTPICGRFRVGCGARLCVVADTERDFYHWVLILMPLKISGAPRSGEISPPSV